MERSSGRPARRAGHALAAAASGLLLALASSPARALEVALEPVADGLVQPVLLTQPADDPRRFIVEQIGRIRILTAGGELLEEPFLDLRDRLAPLDPQFDERGLLGLAFHPEFPANGKFYVYYSAPLRAAADPAWNHTSRIAEFRVGDHSDRADLASERVVLEVDQPQFDHNGGALAFGPDGYLYIALGDGGYPSDSGLGHAPEGNGQARDRLLGKILRIDVAGEPYRVPADNPFAHDPAYRPEIWALGLRNPYRCTFDAAGNGDLWCGDVGEGGYEEVNLIRRGGNYGWRIREGRHCFDVEAPLDHLPECPAEGLTPPVVEYVNCTLAPECRGRAIIGGYVYRGRALPELLGRYVYGDWAAEMDGLGPPLHAASPPPAGDGPWPALPLRIARPEFAAYVIGFGEDAAGELYLLASRSIGPENALGAIYKLVPAG